MRRYRYAGVARLGVVWTQMCGVVAITLSFVVAVAILVLTFFPDVPPDVSILGMICIALWMLILGLLVGFALMNGYPTIWLGEEGLMISAFLFARIPISWTDIVDVGAGRVPFGHVLVRAQRITPLHIIYGWLYSRSLYPSFIIRRDIENKDELINEIRRRMQRHT